MNYLETDEVGGWRMRNMNELTEPYWLEDPSTPLGVVKNYLLRGDPPMTLKRKGCRTGQNGEKTAISVVSFQGGA